MRNGLGLRVLLAIVLYCNVGTSAFAQSASEIVVQVSLTAGLRHHEAKAVWDQLLVGDVLTLIRESENAYDTRAVRVEWKGHKLGYIPRLENEAVARQLDRGNPLQARITKLTYYRNHRRKLEFEVFLPL
jgi:HIRAN domain-containing protein